ncbi:MAG: hypothetical protein ACTSUE_21545 [Promethearchaeota archaeon]
MNDARSHAKEPGMGKILRNGMLILLITGGFLVGTGLFFKFQKKYATILYHYNAEYRAGKTLAEDNVINKAIPAIIEMYHEHPKWGWSINIQSWAILQMNATNHTACVKLVEMVNRGQCELLCPLWSYQLVPAFTADDINTSLSLTREALVDLGVTRFSRVVFFQESQSMPGFGNPIFKARGFDVCLIGTHTLALHGLPIKSRLYKVQLWNDPTTEFYYMPYNWVPEPVEGGFHFYTFLATGETVLGRGETLSNASYEPPEVLIRTHEEHLQKLSRTGYTLMTHSEYVTGLESRGEYETLTRYIPETTWRDVPGTEPARSNSNGLWTWMGYNTKSGNETNPGNDDGAQLAETYRTGNYLRAVKTLLLATWNNLTSINATRATLLNDTLSSAYKFYFKAQSTDAYGWEPSWITTNVLHESDYSRNNNAYALEKASSVLSNMSTMLGLGNDIQIYTGNRSLNAGLNAYSNTTGTWLNKTSVPSGLSMAELPVGIDFTITGNSSSASVSINNCSLNGTDFQEVNIHIPDLTESRIGFDLDYPIWYSPSLFEDRAISYTLEGDEPYFLPLSNGLLFSGSESSGVAIIKNCSSRHVSLELNRDWIGFWEFCKEGQKVKNVEYSFAIMSNISLHEAINLATLINTSPIVNLHVS